MLEHPEQFLGKSIDIASDELTGEDAARILSEATGRQIQYFQTPIEAIREMSDDYARNVEWMIDVGYSADIAGLRRDYPEVGWETFEEWAQRQDWTVLDQAAVAS